jgi:hypothetical protein
MQRLELQGCACRSHIVAVAWALSPCASTPNEISLVSKLLFKELDHLLHITTVLSHALRQRKEQAVVCSRADALSDLIMSGEAVFHAGRHQDRAVSPPLFVEKLLVHLGRLFG